MGQDDRLSAVGRNGALSDYAASIGDGYGNSGVANTCIDYYQLAGPCPGANGVLLCNSYYASPSGVHVGSACQPANDPDLKFSGEPLYMRMRAVTDGASKTLLIGEKHVPPRGFGYYRLPSGEFTFDSSIYNGDDYHITGRFAGVGFGLARSIDEPVNVNFGGAHPGVCQFAFVDGSVHALAVAMDEVTLGYLANRRDGKTPSGF
jgi:prepilin-type processing-associated H-X9-DG protein